MHSPLVLSDPAYCPRTERIEATRNDPGQTLTASALLQTIGDAVTQVLARMPLNRVERLFFFDFVYPDIDACETAEFLNAAFPTLQQRGRSACVSHVQEPCELDGVFDDDIPT